MKKYLLAAVAVFVLSACSTTDEQKAVAAVDAAAAKIVTITCQIDAAAPGAVTVGGTVAVVLDPALAPEVATLSAAEQLLHPAVAAACAVLKAKPVSVAVSG